MNITLNTSELQEHGFTIVTLPIPDFQRSSFHSLYSKTQEFFKEDKRVKEDLGAPRPTYLAGYKKSTFREQVEVRLDTKGAMTPSIPSIEQEFLSFWSVYEKASIQIANLLAQLIGLPQDYFLPMMGPSLPHHGLSTNSIRICMYNGDENAGKPFVCPDHTDVGFITLISCSLVPGLECFDIKSGEWVDVESKKIGQTGWPMVIVVGDTLSRLSNGYYKATRHRVVTPVGTRISYSYHVYLKPDAVIDVKSICEAGASAVIGEPHKKYTKNTTVGGVYLDKKRQNMQEEMKNNEQPPPLIEWVGAPAT